ncbi:MAG TPA: hypothetical protein PLL10_01500, partial [Elusimicrobiales bacterium]|nr:hypothetical protein [Elusimicrobiales bacterium]
MHYAIWRLGIIVFVTACASFAYAQENDRLFTQNGELSFSLPQSSWSVTQTTATTALTRQDGQQLLIYGMRRLFPEHKNSQSAHLLVRNSVCKHSKCIVSQSAERFATTTGPSIYRVLVTENGSDRMVYLIQLDKYYFAAERSGLGEEELLSILSSAQTYLPDPDAVKPEPKTTGQIKPRKLSLRDLFPSPQELAMFNGWILGAQAIAFIALALLGLRLLLPRPKKPHWKTEDNSPYPITLEKKYLRPLDTVIIKDALKERYRLVSSDPAMLLKAGLLLFLLAKVGGAVATSIAGLNDWLLTAFSTAPRY